MNTSEIVNVLRQVSDKLEKSENVESSVNEVVLKSVFDKIKSELNRRDFVLKVSDYMNDGDLDVTIDYNRCLEIYIPDSLDIEDFVIESVGDMLDDVFDNLKKELNSTFSQEEK